MPNLQYPDLQPKKLRPIPPSAKTNSLFRWGKVLNCRKIVKKIQDCDKICVAKLLKIYRFATNRLSQSGKKKYRIATNRTYQRLYF